MKILISGATGLVGRATLQRLVAAGHEVGALVRREAQEGIHWNVDSGELNAMALRKFGEPDAFIHLAGESIAARRWSNEVKRRIRSSRVEATEKLASFIVKHLPTIRVFVAASATGFYGDRGDEVLAEGSVRGEGFLADVCDGWERATQPLAAAGVRVVHLRFGMILSREGGALAKMLPAFRMGVGGRVGSGEQWMSWISIEDAERMIEFVLLEERLAGVFNAVAPEPVRNREFTAALARELYRPAVLPLPAAAVRILFGEMGEALLLSSQRVVPERLEKAGFRFEHPTLGRALVAVLKKN